MYIIKNTHLKNRSKLFYINMSHKMMIDTILVNLKVLSKVGENGKISFSGNSSNNQICINEQNFLTPLYRYISGDSRHKTILIINEIINNAIQISNNMLQNTCMTIYDKLDKPSSYEISKFNKQFQSLKSISTEFWLILLTLFIISSSIDSG